MSLSGAYLVIDGSDTRRSDACCVASPPDPCGDDEFRMKILFLLSSLEPAGSETYALSLSRAWAGKHETFWISDRLHFGQTYQSLPISKKIFPGGILNVLKVSR